jgi:hypothetical protein
MTEKHEPHWAIAALAEQTAPADSIRLTQKIMVGRAADTQRQSLPKARLAGALALSVFALATLVFVPGARAYAEDIFQRLGLAFVDTDAFGRDADSMEAVPALPASAPNVAVSLDELRAQIGFPLLAPTELPAGLDHVRREVRDLGDGAQVYLSYALTPEHTFEEGVLLLIAREGALSAPPLLAASREQAVSVNEQSAIYVHGGWQDNGQGDPDTRFGDLLWDDAVDSAYLTWEQDGVTYLLQAHGLGLAAEDLLQIASSMSG